MKQIFSKVQSYLADNETEASLKLLIIAVAIFWVVIALMVHNKWALAAIAAYLILP